MRIFLFITLISLTFLHQTSATQCSCNAQLSSDVDPFKPATNVVTQIYQVLLHLLDGSPGIPQKIGVVTAAMFDAFAITTGEYMPTSDICLEKVDDVSVEDNIVYAAYTAMTMVFKDEPTKLLILDAAMQKFGFPADRRPSHVGTLIAKAVLSKFKLSMPMPPYMPPNPPSSMFDASCESIKDPDGWQGQCVQMIPGKKCMPQMVMFAMLSNASMISFDGEKKVGQLLASVPKPPVYEMPLSTLGSRQTKGNFVDEHMQVLKISAELNDYKKVQAEVFAPNGVLQVGRLALNEVQVRKLSLKESIKVLFVTSAAIRDAIVASVTLKLKYNTVRPITVIQCGYRGKKVKAWSGPYMGVKEFMNQGDEKWRSYLQTPPFPGYVSGHSSAAGAGAYVLEQMFKDGPKGANCYTVKTGMSKTEPRIEKGAMGYIAGVTNVPNRGMGTVGFSPRNDTTICWASWGAFANQLSKSRLLGGIHIPMDNEEGKAIGRVVGKKVFEYFQTREKSDPMKMEM